MKPSCRGRVRCAGGRPTVGTWVEPAAGIEKTAVPSPPDDHFTACPDCPVTKSGTGHIGHAGGYPAVRVRIVSPAGIQKILVIPPTPDDHLVAGPDCRMIETAGRHVHGACFDPTIGTRIVSPPVI